MRRVLLVLLALMGLQLGATVFAADNPNLLVMGEDADPDTVPRNSRVFKRVVSALASQMHDNRFDVYDETAVTLDNFAQGRVRRTDAEIIDIARSVKRPPIDVAVIFSIYASAKDKGYTTRVRARIEGRLLNVKTGKRLGNFEVKSNRRWNAPADCDRECILEVVGDKAKILANDLGSVLAEKLAWMVDGVANATTTLNGDDMNRAGTNNMMTEYALVFDGFSAEEVMDIEEYLVIFSGYHSHRPITSSHTHHEYWYKSSISTAKLDRNLKKMLKELNMRGTVSFDGNTYTVQKITLRGKRRKLSSGNW